MKTSQGKCNLSYVLKAEEEGDRRRKHGRNCSYRGHDVHKTQKDRNTRVMFKKQWDGPFD